MAVSRKMRDRKKKNRFKKLLERPTCRWTDPKTGKCTSGSAIDYKDVELLQKFVSAQGKLANRKRIGACNRAQHHIQKAVARAKFMGLLPYTS